MLFWSDLHLAESEEEPSSESEKWDTRQPNDLEVNYM